MDHSNALYFEKCSLAKPTRKKEALIAPELENVILTTKSTENATRYAILLTLTTTGMLKGELAGLTWNDLDFKQIPYQLLKYVMNTEFVHLKP